MELPERLKYTTTHEWIADNGDGTVTVGITAVATEQLGDLVYVELPKVGASVAKGASCAVVESTKAASDVYAPLSGDVVAANEDLGANPGEVNASPYEKGWLFKLKLKNRAELGELMARDEYAKAAGV
ncbi:MAG: glycine cleavage system protein GcvH [Betaproteobacteria bacterium]|nr:MAG: glycine cleavage system protein GcvH [Betaproteobacteria bacterium]